MSDTNEPGTQSAETAGAIFVRFSVNQVEAACANIRRCVERLSEDELWHRSGDWENSVGNLVMHLEGNIRQFVLHAVGGRPSNRQRDREFSLDYRCSRQELTHLFDATLAEVLQVLAEASGEDLITYTDPHIPGLPVMTKMECIYKSVAHFHLHTGQIIFLTKQIKASDLDLSIPRKR